MADKYTEVRKLQAYQCDRYGNVRPLVLMNELQSVADTHAEKLGVGRTFLLQNNLAWVVTHYLVDIVELPHENEELHFITWPSVADALRTVRDFEIRGSDNRLMVRATSQWILIDMTRRRPVVLTDKLPERILVDERALDRKFDKFPDFDAEKTHVMKCRFDDVDVNQHINNAVYAVWATESVGYEYRNEHKLCGIELNYKKEINPETPEVNIDVKIDGDTSYHKIRTDAADHAIVICHWTKKE